MNSGLNYRSPKAFFVQRSHEEYEKEWQMLMEQSFQLKHHGHFTLFEQSNMTAEERKWWMERLKRHEQEREEAMKKQKN